LEELKAGLLLLLQTHARANNTHGEPGKKENNRKKLMSDRQTGVVAGGVEEIQ
jgi:hypothetical protein